jgi:arylsulfatase A-like enzyme
MARPNILLIMADQLRADAIGAARTAGGEAATTLQTPNLDRLCREGVRFARAYTESPVCVSARATILTGRLPHRTGVVDNGYRLAADTQTLPKLLGERGYFGQAVGKMHFSPVREHHGLDRLWLSEEIPRTVEEDEFLSELIREGYGHVEEPHGIRHEMYYVPQVSQLPEARHTTAWTGARTIAFLEEHVRERERGSGARGDEGQPFFCWTSFIKPHPPFDPPVPWNTLYRPTDLPLGLPVRAEDEVARHTYYHRTQNRFKWTDAQPDTNLLGIMRAYYAACVSFIDFWVGQILDTLERLGLRENTLVLFLADHGEYLGDHYAFGKRGYHDPACRVPFIVSWPGHVPQGAVRHDLVGLADVLPTCVAASDGSGEQLPALEVDGQDLLPLARAEEGSEHRGREHRGREVLLGQLARGELGLYAAIEAEWKYVYSTPDDREYLFFRGSGEGQECDARECVDHAHSNDPAARAAMDRLRAALVERFKRDGYAEALDETGARLRRYGKRAIPWEPLDEIELRSTVARGWQYARWNAGVASDLRQDPPRAAYRFTTRAAAPGRGSG